MSQKHSIIASSVGSTKVSISSLDKKLKDLNISTSYIQGETDSDKTESPVLQHSRSRTSLAVTPCNPFPIKNDAGTQTDDLRKAILARIGLLYDSSFLTGDETAEAINLAMQRDDTCELMASLLSARNTLEGQGQFMKMWINTRMRQRQTFFAPPPQSITPFITGYPGSHHLQQEMLIRPRPVYCNNTRMDTPEEDISQISLQTMVRSDEPPRPSPPPPNPSPPLFPTVLQFNDPMFYRSSAATSAQPSLAHFMSRTKLSTPSSCSTGTPMDQIQTNSLGDNHGLML